MNQKIHFVPCTKETCSKLKVWSNYLRRGKIWSYWNTECFVCSGFCLNSRDVLWMSRGYAPVLQPILPVAYLLSATFEFKHGPLDWSIYLFPTFQVPSFFVATSPLIFPKHVFCLPLFNHYDIASSMLSLISGYFYPIYLYLREV